MSKERKPDLSSAQDRFRLKYHGGYATLTVNRPDGRLRPVYADEVLGRMRMLGIPEVRRLYINQIIEKASGKPERLAAWPEGARFSARLDVSVSDDEMIAVGVMHPPQKGGGTLSKDDVLGKLKDNGVVFGIEMKTIGKMLDGEVYSRKVVLARGKPAKDGQRQRVEYLFNTQMRTPYLIMEYGRINLKELDFVQNRKKGEVLAELVEPSPPEDGSTVTGRKLGAHDEGETQRLKTGKNTELSPDGDKIIASMDGNAFLKNGAVHVESVVTVENVDYSTGNIDSNGSVVVKGTVADGFTIKAKGNVEVGKSVGKITIESERDILLRAGMNGNSEGLLKSDGDILSRYIENSRIHCRKNLIVEEAVMHSDIRVGGSVLLTGRRAELLAGKAVIGKSLLCKKLGGVSEIRTDVSLGVSPTRLDRYHSILRIIENKRTLLDQLDSRLQRLRKKTTDSVDEETATAYRTLMEQTQSLSTEIGQLEYDAREYRDSLEPLPDSVLISQEMMYNGAVVTFGRVEYRVPLQGLRKTILRVKNGKITESGYNADELKQIEL